MENLSLGERLTPVYNAIDNEKYSLAIKICDKALAKGSKDSNAIKALKSLAMVRSGSMYQASYDLAHQVKMTRPIDSPTLQACFMTFKFLHMYDDIIDMYSVAFTMCPTNEELANHWFMALARKGDWKALQQVSSTDLTIGCCQDPKGIQKREILLLDGDVYLSTIT